MCTLLLNSANGSDGCLDVDYSNRFGPDRDQNGHGSCWMMTTAGLFEEQNCIVNPSHCGESISPMSVGRCDFSIGSEKEGRNPSRAMQCVLSSGGACLEKHSPYKTGVLCQTIGNLSGKGMKCGTERIKYYLAKARLAKTKNARRSALNSLWFSLPSYTDITIEEMVTMTNNDVSDSAFLKRAYITKQCRKNLIDIPGKKVIQTPAKSFKVSNLKKELRRSLFSGLRNGSVGVSLKMGEIVGSSFSKDSHHAVIVNGMRKNKDTGKCEIKIKNSWGRGAKYHGWYPLENILPAIYQTYYFTNSEGKQNRDKEIIEDSSN